VKTISEKLADFSSRFDYESLTRDQIAKLKLYFLDWLGSAYAGASQKPVQMVLAVAKRQGGAPQATLIPDGSRSSGLMAALVNGASSHVVEMDDLHKESVLHPAAAIIPAILAAAESEGSSGRELIQAMAVGYEVGIRVAVGAGVSHYNFWHTTGTCGTFGAAAGAGRILGLSPQQMTWALGSAGTQASGLWAFLVENAMSKQLHPGKAAMNGLLAALLAREGFTGAVSILESEKGFFRATSRDFDEKRCVDGLGKELWFERNSLKYHASCGHTHSAIDATIEATKGKRPDPERISTIRVKIYRAALDLLGNVEPKSPYLAKFCLPFCVATALLYGRVGLGAFTPERLADKKIQDLMRKVEMEEDPELTALYPRKWPAEVEIHLRDGGILRSRCWDPKGDPENPLTEEEVREKFMELTEGILPESRAARICEMVMELERVDRVSRLFH
jgi:2-methylcitrate dehydratase PrpD